jgi:hypothetical protein
MQLEAQKHQMSMQMEQEKHHLSMQMELEKHNQKTQFDLAALNHDAALKERSMQFDHENAARAEESQRAEKAKGEESNAQLTQVLVALAKGEAAIQQGISQLIEHEGAETELIRDPVTQRAKGARKVRKSPGLMQ